MEKVEIWCCFDVMFFGMSWFFNCWNVIYFECERVLLLIGNIIGRNGLFIFKFIFFWNYYLKNYVMWGVVFNLKVNYKK